MASTIFNLGGVKILKDVLRFNSSDVQIITGQSADPTVTAYNAVIGSIYIRTNGEIYIKNSSGNNTDFRKILSQLELDNHINDISDAHAASAITNTPSGNLAATNVQSALNELQSDVDTRALDSIVIKKDGSVAYTANQSMGGFRLTALATPTAASDAATKQYVDNAIEGISPKAAVRATTTANITLSGTQTVDGVTLVAGNRILVKDQTTAADNGIYIVAAGAWSRSTDMDSLSPIDEFNKSLVAVQEGTTNQGKIFVQYGTVTTLGTDPVNFTFFNSVSGIVAGNGVTVSGNNISVNHDGNGLQFIANQLALELDGATLTTSSAGLKLSNTAISAASYGSATQVATFTVDAQGRLTAAANTTIAITSANVSDFTEAAQDAVGAAVTNSSKVSLTYNDAANTITADIVAASLTNADIASAAAIARTKLSALTANRAMITDASGFDVVSAVTSTELGYVSGVTSAIQTQLDSKHAKGATDFVFATNAALTANTSNEVITGMTFAFATYNAASIEYRIKKGTLVRVGRLMLSTDGTNIAFNDMFVETVDSTITFEAVINGANINIRHSNTETGTINITFEQTLFPV